MALANTNVDLPGVYKPSTMTKTSRYRVLWSQSSWTGQPLCVVCLIRLHDKLVLLDVETKGRLVLNVTLGTQFYFYHESQATQCFLKELCRAESGSSGISSKIWWC
ncbi:uncharacterized protein LOC106360574 isoform X2 [Brassica napus]|uniref:uncharacterized protein LOC106360574 isoform X2 n=1 Tax=Brassica napus TaxID=3708 RepID=UPI0006AA847C|nr:uncharacterized protein LOC106360574 isoform X2 [Brassica napus]